MMIRVLYHDGRFDMVKPKYLASLLDKQKVTGFKRSEGWVMVGRDPLRVNSAQEYHGPERRSH
ncbi:MAG: hypothetical protein JRF07_06480 [Deltaproteobacteria bacterium]|nr:hypothetical protein [Deltaproteobacteria bacterium]MBW2476730.1 hypothetical protein [Deltaproteobacteria bacterium]MBW2519796.1 hypothetical protein [Deltaproteobacteria bacterium]